MKTEPNDTAFPTINGSPGLTILQYFAAKSLCGLRANCDLIMDAQSAATQAVNDALALIAELNKQQS